MSVLSAPTLANTIDLWEGMTLPAIGLRIYDRHADTRQDMVGVTCFFRHPEMYETALDCAADLHSRTGGDVKLLCAGGSVGAEAYSLSYMAALRGMQPWLRIQSLDLSAMFGAIGRAGIYPREVARVDDAFVHDDLFEDVSEQYVRVRDDFRQHVTFLQPMAFADMPRHNVRSDITISAMALMYTGNQHNASVKAMAQGSSHALLTDDALSRTRMHVYGFEPRRGQGGVRYWQRNRPLCAPK